jgi:hypothetical protein
MRPAGPGEQLTALVGDLRVVAALVLLAARPGQQPVALQAIDEPRQAAAAEQHAVRELRHAQAAARRLGEEQENLVRGQRQLVLAHQLGVERLR